jgi:hypothetical protein
MKGHALQNLIDSIYTNYPNVCDIWEIVAIIEALGYTDRIIETEFGCPNSLILSQFIYAQRDNAPFLELPDLPATKPTPKLPEELQIFVSQFSHSFIYTVPFIILLILDHLPIDKTKDFLPAEMNALLAVVTMASLITSSGFVQMISRRGSFYVGLKDPIQANRICIPILWMGIFTTIIFGLLGILFGFYQRIAPDNYIIIAGIYYAIMSTIWMLFAVVEVHSRFAAPIILIGITCCFVFLRVLIHLSAIESQIIIITIASLILIATAVFNTAKYRPIQPKFGSIVSLPKFSVLVYLLSPHFLYGIIYFGFIFADRLAANLANAGIYTLVPGNNLGYQNSMDIALLDLLLIVPLVEYFSYKLITFWYDLAKNITLDEIDSLAWRVQKRYWSLLSQIFSFFGMLMVMTLILLSLVNHSLSENILTIFACFGYLLFAIGLFNTVVLLSLDRLRDVLDILTSAMTIDFIIAYLLSSVAGVYFAVIGLIVGGAIFAIASSRKTLDAIDRADYCYFYSGY